MIMKENPKCQDPIPKEITRARNQPANRTTNHNGTHSEEGKQGR
jgi:hypothetical protein